MPEKILGGRLPRMPARRSEPLSAVEELSHLEIVASQLQEAAGQRFDRVKEQAVFSVREVVARVAPVEGENRKPVPARFLQRHAECLHRGSRHEDARGTIKLVHATVGDRTVDVYRPRQACRRPHDLPALLRIVGVDIGPADDVDPPSVVVRHQHTERLQQRKDTLAWNQIADQRRTKRRFVNTLIRFDGWQSRDHREDLFRSKAAPDEQLSREWTHREERVEKWKGRLLDAQRFVLGMNPRLEARQVVDDQSEPLSRLSSGKGQKIGKVQGVDEIEARLAAFDGSLALLHAESFGGYASAQRPDELIVADIAPRHRLAARRKHERQIAQHPAITRRALPRGTRAR